MQEITLEKQPNQRFSITLGSVPFVISLRTLENGGTLADIEQSGQNLISGLLCRANTVLIPFSHKAKIGNFIFICSDGKYPHYSRFGGNCKFYYASAGELTDANGQTA